MANSFVLPTASAWRSLRMIAAAAAAMCILLALMGGASARADTSTYSATQTIPVPPASDFAGSGGGDGWAVALSSTEVFNVFHHLPTLTVACHNQADATPCWSPETITDGAGNNFATPAQPGLHLDPNTGKLYVFATRTNDLTGGVVCIDTTQAPTNTNPFCGFTALTAAGESPISGNSYIADPSLLGSRWYAFNFAPGAGATGAQNKLLCFDISTDAACAGQPFAVNIGSGTDSDSNFSAPAQAAIGSKVIVPATVGGQQELACFDDTTQSSCAGAWPVSVSGYISDAGAPFPLMDGSGAITGLCLPTGADPCFTLAGASTATPANMSSVIPDTSQWNGPAFVLGPRVYMPDGNSESVHCFDYSTGASCANFPKQLQNLELLYTVNPDPQRPTCIWVNSDGGTQQIQNFDAYTGGSCGQGDVRVLGSQFVVNQAACTPNTYQSLQVVSPDPSTYTSGLVTFNDGDGNPIPGAADRPLDGTGTVSLAGLNLNTPTGLPEFILALQGESGSPGQVVVKLTWTATYDPACIGGGATATPPPTSGGGATPPPTVTTPPHVSGTPLPGDSVTCVPGTWTGNPTGYTYTWLRGGVPIPGATGPTYTVQIGDEAATLTCAVVARNATGSSTPATSAGVVVGYPAAMGCPKPSGKLAAASVGVFKLGLSHSGARALNNHFNVTKNSFDNFCLYAGWGIRVGYPSKQLLATLTSATRSRFEGKAVLALTSNPFYALYGVRPGTKLGTVAKRLHVAKPFHVGLNFWYFLPGKAATGVLKVRGGVIQEVGLATGALTKTRDQQRTFIRSFT